jgi:hypothetical protein
LLGGRRTPTCAFGAAVFLATVFFFVLFIFFSPMVDDEIYCYCSGVVYHALKRNFANNMMRIILGAINRTPTMYGITWLNVA